MAQVGANDGAFVNSVMNLRVS